ncbi:MAG: ubiquinone/menaquinone biosynthesis methyltransferase [Candidatus Heimdallarchaeota archaeon]
MSRMFSSIASRYNLMNNVMTGFTHHLTRRFALSLTKFKTGQRAVDLATGTGDFVKLLNAKGGEKSVVIGCDLSREMLSLAKNQNHRTDFIQADINTLPFLDNSFDLSTISYGLRNVQDPLVTLTEIFRIIRPGGRLIIVESSLPMNTGSRFLIWFHFTKIVPRLASFFRLSTAAYNYYFESVKQFPIGTKFFHLLRNAGWSHVTWYTRLFGAVSIYLITKGVS